MRDKKADLMNAAPAMLAALKRAVALADKNLKHFSGGRTDKCQASYEQCLTAIAKAEGRDT